MNHNRCCANESGNSPSRPTRLSGGGSIPSSSPLSACSNTFPIPSTVGFSNTLRSSTSTPNTSLTLDTTCVASREWPPSSKKFSVSPKSSTLSTSPHIPLNNSSIPALPLSSRPPFSLLFATSGRGNLSLSTFPFPVRGNSFIHSYAIGTMYPGSRLLRYLLTPSGSPSPTIYATSLLSPAASSRAITTASLTPLSSLNTVSISPNSIRYPLTFT